MGVVDQLAPAREIERGMSRLVSSGLYARLWPGAPVPEVFAGGAPAKAPAACVWVEQVPSGEEASADSTCSHATVGWDCLVSVMCTRSERAEALRGALCACDAVRAVVLATPKARMGVTSAVPSVSSAAYEGGDDRRWTAAAQVRVRLTRADAHAPREVIDLLREEEGSE